MSKIFRLLIELKHKCSLNLFFSSINGFYRYYFEARRRKFGYIDKSAYVRFPIRIKEPWNVYLYENCHIMGGALISAINGSRFIMKKNSAAAEGLSVINSTHPIFPGEWFLEKGSDNEYAKAKDIVVEEDVWIATNVTLLCGAHIGRGSIIGAGSVCRKPVPPYAIVLGNPATIIGFKFSPEEVIEHEAILYPEEERLPLDLLKRNYEKYFKNRTGEIKNYIK